MFFSTGKLQLHFTAPCEGGDQLIKTLRSVRNKLDSDRYCIPDPNIYRPMITSKALGEMGGVFMPLEQSRLASEIDENAEVLVLSFNALMGSAASNFNGGPIYPDAPRRIEFIRELFPGREISLFFSAVNPGLVVAGLREAYAMGIDQRPPDYRPLWSEMVDRVQDAHIDLPVSIWATEDTPVTWPAVLRAVLDARSPTPVPGSLHPAARLLPEADRMKLLAALRNLPPLDDLGLMKYLSDFLSEHVEPDALASCIDLPGWTTDIMFDFELLYEQDIESCEDIPGNTALTLETVFDTF